MIHINPKANGGFKNERTLPNGFGVDGISINPCVRRQVNEPDSVNVGNMDDGHNDGMLVHVVERIEGVEGFSGTRRVDRKIDKEVLGVLSGCYHSSRRGFKIFPAAPAGKLGMAIQCTAIDSNQFPYQMVQNAPVVMNGVAKDRRQRSGKIGGYFDFDPSPPLIPTVTIRFNDRTVRVSVDELIDPPFEISEVLIGPL